MYLQVTFEQHKENLSRMFHQYQHQESAGSVRTISGVSQSMEQMESVNGSPTEESAPSTVIELTVDSPSSPTSSSSPTEPSDEAEPPSITVSNILEGAGGEEQKLDEETDVTVTQEKEKKNKEMDKEEPEISTEERTGKPQTLDCDREARRDSSAVEMGEDCTTEVLDTEDKAESGPSNSEEGSMNEADTEEPVVSEQEARSEIPRETASCLESSGTSVFNEDLVDVSSVSDQGQNSDADDSQGESSNSPGPAREDEEAVKTEEIQHEQDEKQENGAEENTEGTETHPVEHDVTERPNDEDNLEQSSTITATTSADQTSESTTPLTAQEGSATSASTSDKQPSEGAATAEEPTTSEQGNAGASSSGKTKEIKIARLDVSNVASDTERLELKETVGVINLDFISQIDFFFKF